MEAYLLESIIQVRDKGEWVADVDILGALDSKFGRVERQPIDLPCNYRSHYDSDMGLSAIDTWEELLEGPEKGAVTRTRGNWISRLAVTCVAANKGSNVYILPRSFCWYYAMAGSSGQAHCNENDYVVNIKDKNRQGPSLHSSESTLEGKGATDGRSNKHKMFVL